MENINNSMSEKVTLSEVESEFYGTVGPPKILFTSNQELNHYKTLSGPAAAIYLGNQR